MVFYLASTTYLQVIATAIKETEVILAGNECDNELYLYKYVKENMGKFTNLDCLIVDLHALQDLDEEIIQAFEMLRIMNYELRIIVLATNRYAGDDLLTKCFQMSIYNIIDSDDFLEIKMELKDCLLDGKQYKDSLRFKDSTLEKVIVKNEIKQTVNKVMIGMVGTMNRIGVTHNAIVLANYLRKRGYLVALAEGNEMHPAFRYIAESFGEQILDDCYFNLEGVDYYPNVSREKLGSILGKSYNFIIVDYGPFEHCDNITFNKSDVRIIIAGTKPWEVEYINKIFEKSDEQTLSGYHFCFNYTLEKDRQDVKEGMHGMDKIYFMDYSENPFLEKYFSGAERILEQYMPIKIENEKKGFFSKRGKKK